MKRTGIIALAGALGMSPCAAQVEVFVFDAVSGEGIPYAHLGWHPIDTAMIQWQVTDPEGRALLAIDGSKAFVLETRFVGFETRVDTVMGTTPLRIALDQALFSLDAFVVTGQYAPTTQERTVHRTV